MKTTDEIINKEFSHSFMGYDMQEVDFFLDEIIERFEKLDAERKEMLSAMEYLLKKVEAMGELTENGDRKRLAAAESTLSRLRGAAAQSIPAGPVRVQKQDKTKKAPEEKPARARPAAKKRPVEPEAEPATEQPPVAIEVETGEWAPDLDTIVPDLIDDVAPLMDGAAEAGAEAPVEAETEPATGEPAGKAAL